MPRVAANADDYANSRVGIFFPGVTRDLDGQCVSLVKWFMAEMSEVPNPQAARGDARQVGHTLVSQGHAIEVPYVQRRRGDIITYENGVFGHIGIVLSGNRTFEENVNLGGAARRVITIGGRSWNVYASRIGSLAEEWRRDEHVYRLKTYNEGEDMATIAELTRDLANATAAAERRKLTPSQVDKVLKMGLRREPTAAELNNPDYQNNPGLLIDTVWNNGGEMLYHSTSDQIKQKLEQIRAIVNG